MSAAHSGPFRFIHSTLISKSAFQVAPRARVCQPTSLPLLGMLTALVGQVYGSKQNACRCGGVNTTSSRKQGEEKKCNLRAPWLIVPFQRRSDGAGGPPSTRSVSTSSTVGFAKDFGF